MTPNADSIIAERFRAAIANQLGLAYDTGKQAFLAEVLKRRAAAFRIAPVAYLERLEAGGLRDETSALAEELTVGETYFFRNNDQFAAFRDVVLPERMAARAATRRLRFLSAGCSSGDEAYSLAIAVAEFIQSPPWRVDIRAIDANPAALERARNARYSNWSLRETPADTREQWFRVDGKDFILDDRIRAAVSFSQANLADNDEALWAPETYDAIFCRNVIMYFTPEVLRAVIGKLTRALAPGGYLFLGSAETLRGLTQDFHLVHTHGAFYYQRRSEGSLEQPIRYVAPASVPLAFHPLPELAVDLAWYEAIDGAARRIAALAAPAERRAAPPPAPKPRVVEPAWSLGATLDLLRRERYEEALATITMLPEEARADPDVMLLQAVLMVQHGRVAAAGEVCTRLLAADEMNAGANYVLGLCFEGTGNHAVAAHHYEAAVHLDPDFALPHLHLGLLARRAGDRDEARQCLEKALTLLLRETPARLLLFGGGFTRDGLIALCEAELRSGGSAP